MKTQEDGLWHLDKKVPLALILTITLQTGAFVWWAAGLNERVAVLERGAITAAPQADRLTRVEVKIENIQEGVNEIKSLIRQRPPAP